MNIIVSHAQKQHVYRLVFGLKKHRKLKIFFTSLFFAEDSLLRKVFSISKKNNNLIKKRSFNGIEKKDVKLTIIPELFFQSMKFFMPRLRSYYMDRLHDHIVSWYLSFYNYDVIIGYERQSLKSFQKAKRQGKTTILDLASIHAQTQREINHRYDNIITGFEPSTLLDTEKKVKAEELKYTDYVITLSSFAKQSCIDNGVSEEKIFTVQLGIDIDNFKLKKNYDNDIFEILFVSGMRHFKGLKDLIETFNELNLPNARLTLVGGSGDALEYVKEQVNDNITYIPYLHHEELKNVYQRASIFVLPSYMDSWAQVVCEAMACGTPVVVSENTGAKDLVENNINGFIVDVADKEALGKKIRYFYENKNEIKRMGHNAREAVEHLTWEYYYDQIDNITQKIESRLYD